MKHFSSFTQIDHPITATVGTFDGLHIGHQAVIRQLCADAHARGTASLVVTFDNNPKTFFNPSAASQQLCSTQQKIQLLEEMGVDQVLLLPFDAEIANLSAEMFIKKLAPQALVLGYDTTFGKNGEGTQEAVMAISKKIGLTTTYIDAETDDQGPISSSRIRLLIQKGELEAVPPLLGRPYTVEGEVKPNKGLGKKIGSPTANITLNRYCTPPFGVYAVTMTNSEGDPHEGIANFGLAPTVEDRKTPVLETFLFNFNGSLYNKKVQITLHHFIRTEQQFPTVQDLREQIQKDVKIAKQWLQKRPKKENR